MILSACRALGTFSTTGVCTCMCGGELTDLPQLETCARVLTILIFIHLLTRSDSVSTSQQLGAWLYSPRTTFTTVIGRKVTHIWWKHIDPFFNVSLCLARSSFSSYPTPFQRISRTRSPQKSRKFLLLRTLLLGFCRDDGTPARRQSESLLHTTASGYYELKPGDDNSVVTVDGMVSPLITLQYGTVRSGPDR